MKIYVKDNVRSTYPVDDTWEEIEDEFVETPIGTKLKSELETVAYKEQLEAYNMLLLRERREQECFSVINRGALWYRELTYTQEEELNAWYKAWLDVTETKIVPEKPVWLK